MKKFVLAVICFAGFQSSLIAQETVEMTSSEPTNAKEPKVGLYVGFGATFMGDYNINSRLQAAGVPQLTEVLPEFTAGINVTGDKWLMDVEATANYSDEKNATNRIRTAMAGAKLRGHYIPFKTESFFVSGGLDLSMVGTQVDIFRRGNVIDLNDLDPSFHSGHISLRNNMLYAGPSVAVGIFQNKSFPLRFNFGYDFGLTNGKWKSDFADVANTVEENGHGRFYARLTLKM